MPGYRVTVGNVDIISLSDGSIEFSPAEFLPTVPDEAWEPYRDQLTPEGKISLNVGSFLLRSDGKTLLVDTGLGEGHEKLQATAWGLLLKDIAANGVRLEEIDMVIITHLHSDHVGWNLLRDGDAYRPTFPAARYWVPKADWDIYSRRARTRAFSYIKEQVIPLEGLGLMDLMEGEKRLTSEVIALPTPGHTDGHTSVLVSSQGEQAVILGDAAHLPAQVHETDWSPRADINPELSRETRRHLMERAERDGWQVIGGHFPAPGFGRLLRLKGRRYWQAL